jgi:prolyl 4-hydroxylase
VLSWYPRIVLYPNFIDAERCDRIIELSRARLTSSMVAFTPDMTVDPKQQMRTSSGVFVAREDDDAGVLAWAEERIAAVTMIPAHHGEAFNVLRYENNQKYDAHLDTFDPKLFGPQKSQRVATAIMYLSDVEDGGETAFQLEGRGGEGEESGVFCDVSCGVWCVLC